MLTAQEETQMLELLQQEAFDKCMNDCEFFIENYVYIEDKDGPEIAILFKMWDGQKKALRDFIKKRLNIVLKARQLGLTWLALSFSAWNLLKKAGYTITALSKKEDDAKELVRRVKFILRHLPDWMIVHKKDISESYKGMYWEDTTLSITIHHPKGEASIFTSMSAAPDSGRSFTSNLVFIDEWAFQQWAKEIWSAAYPTINRPTGGNVIGLSTGKRGTLFEELWNKAQTDQNNFNPIFLNWKTDPRRTSEWYEQTRKDLPHSYRSEYPTNPEDAFSVGEGAFFEEWDEDIHVIDYWEPPKNWPIVGAYDAGFATYACFKWYAISKDGWAICFKEYYPHRITDTEQAKEIVRLSCYNDNNTSEKTFYIDGEEITVELPGTPYAFQYIVGDSDAWTASRDTGKSTQQTFHKFGITMRQASKNLENGWRMLHEWLKPFEGHDGEMMALLRFTKNCHNTRKTYPSCECSKTNPEDIDKNNESHCQDVDRYFCMSRPKFPKPEEQDKRYVVGGKYFRKELEMRGFKKYEIKLLEKKGKITIIGG